MLSPRRRQRQGRVSFNGSRNRASACRLNVYEASYNVGKWHAGHSYTHCRLLALGSGLLGSAAGRTSRNGR